MSRARAVALLLLSVGFATAPASPVIAVDLQVDGSEGTSEALIPGLGWRRAVIGRTLPPGSVVTTWVDSTVTISGEGIVVDVAPLTHLSLMDGQAVGLSLAAGRIVLQSEQAVTIRVPIRDLTVESPGPVRLILTTMDILVGEGEVRLVFLKGRPHSVTSGQSVSLVPHDLVPIIPAQ